MCGIVILNVHTKWLFWQFDVRWWFFVCVLAYVYPVTCVFSYVCSEMRALLCLLSSVFLTCVLWSVCSYMSCVLWSVCSYMCALICVFLYVFAPICVSSPVCSQMCALIHVLSICVLSHLCCQCCVCFFLSLLSYVCSSIAKGSLYHHHHPHHH